jgi:hypothetical protein
MATISLYASQINQMPGLIADVKKVVIEYKAELESMERKVLTINKSVCDLDDVMGSTRASTQLQDHKIASLDDLGRRIEQFAENAARIDNAVADLKNKRKDEFYQEHSHLKPECEKGDWEKILDAIASAPDWCAKHWKLAATVFVVALAIICIASGVGGVLGMLALGAVWGAGIGGTLGGVVSAVTGGSFLDGLESGAFSGMIAGIIGGGMAAAFTSGAIGVTLNLRQILFIGGTSGAGSSLVSDLADILISGKKLSLEQVLGNMAVSGALGVAFAGFGKGALQAFRALRQQWYARPDGGMVEFVMPKTNPSREQIPQIGQYVKGCNAALDDGALSPSGRISTKGELGSDARYAAKAERAAAIASGNPYEGVVGHVPDTTWTGNPQPHSWLDLDNSLNSSLGRQARDYPIGYRSSKFVFDNPLHLILSQSLGGTMAKPATDALTGE